MCGLLDVVSTFSDSFFLSIWLFKLKQKHLWMHVYVY